MALAQSNATLTKITNAGVATDWDVAGTPGTDKWTGTAPAYYTEKRERVDRPEATDVVLRRYLIVEDTAAALIDNDDILTFTYAAATQTGRVRMIERRDLSGVPGEIRTTRLTLEDA